MTNRFFWLKTLALSCALVVPALALSAPDTNNPKSYTLRLPVALAADAAIQRLVLPSQALVNLQTPNYSDIRIFNAQGQSMPMALTSGAALVQMDSRKIMLPAHPILGSVAAAGLDDLSLRIEEQQGKRVVQINTGGNTGTSSSAKQQKVLGALLDARAVNVPVTSMTLDVDMPANEPINFILQTSKDLKNWLPLTSAVLYRSETANGSSTQLGDSTLAMPATDLAGNYLRVTWESTAGLTGQVNLRSATLTSSNTIQNPRMSVNMALLTLSNPHSLSFTLPFATPLAALQITPNSTNALIPVHISGRNDKSQPWSLIANTVIYKLTNAGKEQVSRPIELPGASFQEIKIEADKASPGFVAAPNITLQFEPVQIAFLASGPAPFTLAAGLDQAASAYLPIASLMPGYRAAQENALPLAQVDSVASLVVTKMSSDVLPTRSLVLWGVLLLGVLALSGMAWILLKQTQKPPQPQTKKPSE